MSARKNMALMHVYLKRRRAAHFGKSNREPRWTQTATTALVAGLKSLATRFRVFAECLQSHTPKHSQYDNNAQSTPEKRPQSSPGPRHVSVCGMFQFSATNTSNSAFMSSLHLPERERDTNALLGDLPPERNVVRKYSHITK